MSSTNYTYFVSGKVFYRTAGADAGYDFPGLVDTVDLAITEQVVNLPDRTQPGGGNYDQIRRIESVNVTLNCRELKAAMLAKALFGATSDISGASATDEQGYVLKGGITPLEHPGAYTAVTITTDDTSPAAVSTDNYTVTENGIEWGEDAPDVADGDGVLISYTYPAYSRIEALTNSAPELEIMFIGQNEARDDKIVRVKLHKVRLGAAAQQALLSGDDFGALQLTGEVLKDTTITTAGKSKYFYEDLV